MSKTKVKFTYNDYKSLPESETKRYELLKGELVMVPSPTFDHQRISRNLQLLLWEFVRERSLGEVLDAPMDVVFGEGKEREITQPDIFFVSKERKGIISEQEIRGAPDLIIEIISPATEKRDRGYKRTLYAHFGVKEYWLVDPNRKMVEVLTLEEKSFEQSGLYGEKEAVVSPLLEDLNIDLKQVFSL